MALPLVSTLPVRLCLYEVFSAMPASGRRCYILFYAVVSGMGLFLPGASVAAHCSATEVFSQDTFPHNFTKIHTPRRRI